jgi:cell division septum initiation protein DivIVA
MANLSKKQKKEIIELEKEIKEGESLWQKIKSMPKQDKKFSKQLKEFITVKKGAKKPKISKAKKEQARKIFGGIEPPEKKKTKPKKKKAKR